MKKDIGILIIRVGIGIMFMIHGYPKLAAGQDLWINLGKAMGVLGINFYPVFWGFMAAASEFFGGLLLVIGFGFKAACAFMAFTMFVASSMHLSSGDGIKGASHAIELFIALVGLMVAGPGEYTVSKLIGK